MLTVSVHRRPRQRVGLLSVPQDQPLTANFYHQTRLIRPPRRNMTAPCPSWGLSPLFDFVVITRLALCGEASQAKAGRGCPRAGWPVVSGTMTAWRPEEERRVDLAAA